MPLTEEAENLKKEIDAWKKRWGELSAHMREHKKNMVTRKGWHMHVNNSLKSRPRSKRLRSPSITRI